MSDSRNNVHFKLTYELIGAGWALSVIEVEDARVQMCVSYLHDTLEQLTAAALHLVRKESLSENVVFMDEPGEYLLELNRETDTLVASLTYFEDWKSWGMFDESRHQADKLMQFNVSVKKFAMDVLNILFNLHKLHGLEGYKSEWMNDDFPFDKYQALETAIKTYK